MYNLGGEEKYDSALKSNYSECLLNTYLDVYLRHVRPCNKHVSYEIKNICNICNNLADFFFLYAFLRTYFRYLVYVFINVLAENTL